MANRIVVHVGAPKTGTTFLQSVVWANQRVLKEQGVLLPLHNVREHFYLSCIVRDSPGQLAAMPPSGRTSWERMLAHAAKWEGDVLLSHELFSSVPAARARWAVEQLRGTCSEVHIVVTARDLARQTPAEWQQSVKHGRSHRLVEFLETIKSEDPTVSGGSERTLLFWKVQDLPRVLDDWGSSLPPEQIHVVTVPPSGAPRGLLWSRFAALLGVDAATVDDSVNRPNESLGVAEIETLRRVNEQPPHEVEGPARQLLLKTVLAEDILTRNPVPEKFAVPANWHRWIVQRGTRMVDELRELGYDVIGDLEELVPPTDPAIGPNPDDTTDTAVAAVAVRAVSDLLYRDAEVEAHRLKRVNTELRNELEQTKRQLATARQMFRDERALPFRVHVRRQAGLVKRRLLRQSVP